MAAAVTERRCSSGVRTIYVPAVSSIETYDPISMFSASSNDQSAPKENADNPSDRPRSMLTKSGDLYFS
jgi:hypothetical protein